MFRSGFPTEGYFVSHIFEGAGLFAGTNADLMHSFSDRKDVVLNAGQTNFSVRGEAVDLIGTGAGESITASQGDDILHGAGGNDNLIGAGGQDIVWGGAGNDAVAGNDGNDFLGGNAGNDTVDGGEGRDFLTGGGGTDSMLGGEGNDIVMGGDGADTVDGGAGVDTLIAGLGADSVLGGDGADIFVFTQGDSGAAVNQLDTVGDFELGVDFIDLTGFDKAIKFVDAFSDVAFQATITKVEPAAGSEDPVKWSVKIDTNGDGTADQEITVLFDKDSAEGDLSTADFIV
jgi:Ca2+-binding RTX toxin-like protein